MAKTCSFKIDGHKIVDTYCFADIRNTCDCTVIIEPRKFSIDKKLIIEYLKDLQKVFDFKIEVKRSILIHIDSSLVDYKRLAFLTMVRFIWEGYYKPEINFNKPYDTFYKILPLYFKFKKYYPKQDTFRLLMVAVNAWIVKRERFNTNHFLTRSDAYARPYNIDQFKELKVFNSVFDVFCNYDLGSVSESCDKFNFELKTRSDYCKFYKLIHEELWTKI